MSIFGQNGSLNARIGCEVLVGARTVGIMLRISIHRNESIEIWELEGKLAGDWVKELDRCWKASVPQPGVTVEVNLKAVSYIDAEGKQLLAEMHEGGVEIKGCGCMARAVVEEIVRRVKAKVSHVSPIRTKLIG